MVKGHFEPPHPTLPHKGGGLGIIPSPLVGEGQGGGMNATELDTHLRIIPSPLVAYWEGFFLQPDAR
jgi:hypothetical protein